MGAGTSTLDSAQFIRAVEENGVRFLVREKLIEAGAKKQDLVAKHLSEKNRALLLQAYQDAQADAAWCTKHSLQLLDPVMDNTGYIMRLCLRVRNHAQWQDLATQDIVTMRPRQVSKLEEVASGNARVPGTASGESSQTVRSPAPSVCDIPNVAV